MTYIPVSNFARDIAGFIEFRQSQGYVINNVVKYVYRFDKFCAESRPDAKLLTRVLIQEWLSDAVSQGYVDMVGRCSAIRMFGKYLRGIGKDAFILGGSYARDKRTFVPYVFNRNELALFFSAADNLHAWPCGDRFAPLVAPVLFRLMYTCGLRPQEVCGLKNPDINIQTGEICIRSNKSKKERIVVVSDDMLRLLREYENDRNVFFVRTKYYFSRADGLQYTTQQLRVLFDRCWSSSRIATENGNIPSARPYDFRHTYASTVLQLWLNEGKDLYSMLPYLRSYMGHEHFSDTAYYIHILPERLLESTGVDWEKLDSTMPGVQIWD